MVDLPGLLRRMAGDLRDLGVDHALVGGLAVSVRSEPRFTRDVDLAVAVGHDREAEQLVAELRARSWFVVESLEQEAAGRLAAVRLSESPSWGPVVDLLFASSGIEGVIVERADELEVLPGVTVRVATAADLVVLKLLAVADDRPQDEQDLRSLVPLLSPADVEAARRTAQQVEARGYARGRDLVAELEERVGDVA